MEQVSLPAGNSSALIVWSLMIAVGLLTFVIRYFPIALLARLELPELLKRALVYVPPAVMTAIIASALFFPGGAPNIVFDMPRLAAAAFAALVAWKTRSVLWTVIAGMCALWGMQALLS
jgi:branched-subunit amino acid transport protein